MKIRFANYINGNMQILHLDEEFFKGELCFIDIEDERKAQYVTNGIHEVCYLARGYRWLIAYPYKENYVMTVVYDDKKEIVEWYFDVALNTGTIDNIPYEDDLYLDMVITPEGEEIVLDEDELLEAYNSKEIGDRELKLAYDVLDIIEERYACDFEYLKEFTDRLCAYYSTLETVK